MIDGVERNLALVGGVESMSRIQLGLGQSLSDWLRRFQQARSLGQKIVACRELQVARHQALHPVHHQSHDGHEHGRAHGDHREGMANRARSAGPGRARQPPARRRRVGARFLRRPRHSGRRITPRHDSAQRHVAGEAGQAAAQSFDRTSGKGTLTAGNSSPLTDGAASLWVASATGLARLPAGHRRGEARRLGDRRRRFPDRGTADGAGLRDSAPARAQRPDLRRHRPLGNPRGVRRAGAVPHQGAREIPSSCATRRASTSLRCVSARAREPERRQRRARPSVRRNRRAHPEPGRQGTRGPAGGTARIVSICATAARAASRCWNRDRRDVDVRATLGPTGKRKRPRLRRGLRTSNRSMH